MSGRLRAAALAGLLVVPLAVLVVVTVGRRGARPSLAIPSSDEQSVGANPSTAAPPNGDDVVARSDALAQRDPARAREVLRQAVERDPDDVRALAALAKRLLLDESPEAKKLAERCLRLRPGLPACEAVYRRGIDGEPRDDRTSKFLDDCLEANDARVPCLASVVVERLRVSDAEGAAWASEKLEAVAADHVLAALSRARVASAQGRYRAALSGFADACERGQPYACFRAEALRADGW